MALPTNRLGSSYMKITRVGIGTAPIDSTRSWRTYWGATTSTSTRCTTLTRRRRRGVLAGDPQPHRERQSRVRGALQSPRRVGGAGNEGGPGDLPAGAYNPLFRTTERLFQFVERHNIGLLGWGSLAEGFLADDFDLERLEVNDFRRTTLALGRKDNYDKIKEIRGKLLKISRARKMKLVSLVVAWELSHPELTAAIIGVRSPKEAEEMVEAAKSKLTGAELRSFEEAIAGWEPSHTS